MSYNDILRLSDYLYSEKLKSYDPCDITSSPVYTYIEKKVIPHIPYISSRYSIYSFEKHAPLVMRVITPKTKSAMTSAIYASAQFKLYNATKNSEFLARGISELEWLIANRSRWHSGYCWGLPFGWLMGGEVFAPKGTPFPTVTYYATDAFMRAYEITRDKKYLTVAQSTLSVLMRDMPRKLINNGDQLFFSYSPIDRFNVVNVNAYCAAMFARVNFETNFIRYSDIMSRLIRYVLSEQRDDGSWNYWGRFEKERPLAIDSLHQCYILKLLFECYRYGFKTSELYLAIERGLSYFNNTFYHDGEIWKFNPKYGPTLEIIDHAEALSMYLALNSDYPTTDFIHEMWGYISDRFPYNKYVNSIYGYSTEIISDIPPYYYSIIGEPGKGWTWRERDIPFFRWGLVQILDAMVDLWVFQKRKNQE